MLELSNDLAVRLADENVAVVLNNLALNLERLPPDGKTAHQRGQVMSGLTLGPIEECANRDLTFAQLKEINSGEYSRLLFIVKEALKLGARS